MHSYRDLRVWQDSMALVVAIYDATSGFPVIERYGLVQQMRRAAVSIPSNVAEGYGRRTAKQRFNFLENALGSLFELETQVELARRLDFIPDERFDSLSATIRGIGRGISALMRYVRDEAAHQPKR